MVKYIHQGNSQDIFLGKTMTEILPLFECHRESAVGVSRCGRFGCSLSRVGLVNAKASNETR